MGAMTISLYMRSDQPGGEANMSDANQPSEDSQAKPKSDPDSTPPDLEIVRGIDVLIRLPAEPISTA